VRGRDQIRYAVRASERVFFKDILNMVKGHAALETLLCDFLDGKFRAQELGHDRLGQRPRREMPEPTIALGTAKGVEMKLPPKLTVAQNPAGDLAQLGKFNGYE
jgi:hypothetical protein